jgi:adenylate cyclase
MLRSSDGVRDVSAAPRLISWIAGIGALETDDQDEALRKQVLILSSVTMTVLAVIWVFTYSALGLYLAASIPFVFQIFTIVNLAVLARTHRYRFFRACALTLNLSLPFLLQLSLGGFVHSSGVILWSFTAPLGAMLFSTRRSAIAWFGGFVSVLVVSGILDPFVGDAGATIPAGIVLLFFVLNVIGVTGTCFLLLGYFVRERSRMAAIVDEERARSDRLLLNVLPAAIAERLKGGESVIADRTPQAGVLFADIARFTSLAEQMSPEEVVHLLDEVFTTFDALTEEHGLEKIKTIGDAYMVASGLLDGRASHVSDLAALALAMQREIRRFPTLEIRIGIDVGPVVAGVIGRSRFIYDLWGDTVNTASRMESHGLAGSIQVTERAYKILAGSFEFQPRGSIAVKGKGQLSTFLMTGMKSAALD